MEKNKIIIESQLRSIIREELKAYLIEEGMLDNIKEKANKFLKSTIAPLAIIGLLGVTDSENVIAKEKQQISSQEIMNEFDQLVTQKEEKLQSFGLTFDAAQQVVAGVVSGARKQKEKELQSPKLSEQEKEEQIFKFQQEELSKLDDIQLVKNIMISKFQNQIEQNGRSTMVDVAIEKGQLGAPKPVDAFTIGLGMEIQNTLIKTDKDITTKTKSDEGYTMLGFNIMDLKSYWGDLVVDNSPIANELQNELKTIYIPAIRYEFGAGEVMKKDIEKQLQKENKVRKLKKRLNELRGLYV